MSVTTTGRRPTEPGPRHSGLPDRERWLATMPEGPARWEAEDATCMGWDCDGLTMTFVDPHARLEFYVRTQQSGTDCPGVYVWNKLKPGIYAYRRVASLEDLVSGEWLRFADGDDEFPFELFVTSYGAFYLRWLQVATVPWTPSQQA